MPRSRRGRKKHISPLLFLAIEKTFLLSCVSVCVFVRVYMWNRGVDFSQALQIPGVVDVITVADIPGKKVRSQFGYDEELLAENEVGFPMHK